MKKFYTIALSALVIGSSALAVVPQMQKSQPRANAVKSELTASKPAKAQRQTQKRQTSPLQPTVTALPAEKNTAASRMIRSNAGNLVSRLGIDMASQTKAPVKAAAQVNDVVGEYYIDYTVELQNGSPYSGEMEVTAGTAANTVVLNIPFINGTNTLIWKITGTLDTETGEITFSKDQATGFSNATCSFMHWDNNNTAWSDIDEIVATYTGNAIEFDQDDAFGLLAATGGYYTLFDMITMEKIIDDPNADPNEGWTSIGNATFVDPWVMTFFGDDPEENPWKVELQRNDEDSCLYRLVDPYKAEGFAYKDVNQSTAKHGYIQFNVADSLHVTFDVVDAGFAYSSAGISKFYCTNTLSYFVHDYNMSPESVISALEGMIPYTTFKDGVLTLSYIDNGDDGIAYDACFGIQGATSGGYGWTDQDDNPVPMIGSITFPTEEGPGKPGGDPEDETWTLLEGKGYYKASAMVDTYNFDDTPVEVDVYECDQKPGYYKFVGVWSDELEKGELIIDATDPDYVVVPVQNTGINDNVDGITYIASASAVFDKDMITENYPDFVITLSDGMIKFGVGSLCLQWPEAPEDSSYGTEAGEWYEGNWASEGYALLPGTSLPDPNEGWTSVGKATLMDGWLLPAFGIDQKAKENWYEVELQQSDNDENIYRLVDPYHGDCPVADYNETTSVGYIQFDVTDPDYVVFNTIEAGFANAQLGVTKFYCYNNLGWAMGYLGVDAATAIAYLSDVFEFVSTYKDGVVALGFSELDGEVMYDACFGVQGEVYGGYAWDDQNGDAANMEARIWFPGVEPSLEEGAVKSIIDEKADVKYYNLLGQPVKNPTNGIYIRGNKKVVIK